MPATHPPPPAGRWLRRLGGAVLALGLFAAAIVYTRSAGADPDATGYRVVGGQAFAGSGDTSASERLGGRALVRTAAFDRWLRGWFAGRRLAFSLAAIALAVGGGCLYLAGLADEGADEACGP